MNTKGMCDQALPAQIIDMSSNCPGSGLGEHIGVLPSLLSEIAPMVFRYPRPDTDGFIRAVADFLLVKQNMIQATGSGLRWLEKLPQTLQPDTIITVAGDFLGYHIAAKNSHTPHILIPTKAGEQDAGLYLRIANEVAKHLNPLLIVTIGVTNPGQTYVDPQILLTAVRKACPTCTIVLDCAYAEYAGFTQSEIAQMAANAERTIALTPLSKYLFLPGIATSWAVTGDPVLRRKLNDSALPYEPSAIGCGITPLALKSIADFSYARTVVCEARDILQRGLGDIFGLESMIIKGPGPWVLINAGDNARNLVKWLGDKDILVQQQTGRDINIPTSWVRISATVPAQAERVVEEIRTFYRENPLMF